MLLNCHIFTLALPAVEGTLRKESEPTENTMHGALRCADTFTCSQRYTLAPRGLAVTLLADDGAHCIPSSGPELLFSAGGVWLEGRVF